MPNPNALVLESFDRWLSELGNDVRRLAEALDTEASRPPPSTRNVDSEARRTAALELIAGSLNYLFKSVDLIHDGIEDLGFLDDAFVLRICSASALPGLSVRANQLEAFSADAELIRDFLGSPDYERLQRYSEGTRQLKVRGRTPSDIVLHDDVRTSFLGEVAAWVSNYQVPSFTRAESTLVRLRSFLATKLPS